MKQDLLAHSNAQRCGPIRWHHRWKPGWLLLLASIILNTGCFGVRSQRLSDDPYTGKQIALEERAMTINELRKHLESVYDYDVSLCTNLSPEELAAIHVDILEENKNSAHPLSLPLPLFRILDVFTTAAEEKYGIQASWGQQYKRRIYVSLTEWVDPEWPHERASDE